MPARHSLLWSILPSYLIAAAASGCAPVEPSIESEIGHPSFGGPELWQTENPTCQIKGNSGNWQAAYCMWLHQADRFDDSEVQNCYTMLDSRPAVPQQPCARNEYFKREICKSLAVDGYFHRSVDECVASDKSVPVVVREGLN